MIDTWPLSICALNWHLKREHATTLRKKFDVSFDGRFVKQLINWISWTLSQCRAWHDWTFNKRFRQTEMSSNENISFDFSIKSLVKKYFGYEYIWSSSQWWFMAERFALNFVVFYLFSPVELEKLLFMTSSRKKNVFWILMWHESKSNSSSAALRWTIKGVTWFHERRRLHKSLMLLIC